VTSFSVRHRGTAEKHMTLGQALQRSAVLPLDARAPSLPRCEHEALEEADRGWRAALLRRLGGPPGRPSS
jgi:hypothetical protein